MSPCKRVAVAADIDRQIGVRRKRLLKTAPSSGSDDLLFLQPDRAGFVHGDVDHVRLVILLRLRGGRQVDLDVLRCGSFAG